MDCFRDFADKLIQVLIDSASLSEADVVCTFSLYEDAGNGVLAAALDTYNNSLLHAKRKEKRLHRDLADARARPNFEDLLPRFASAQACNVRDYNASFGEMKHLLYREYYQDLIDDSTRSDGKVLHYLLDTLDKLVERNAFCNLRLASPFRLGICTWESEDMWVTKILDWPVHSGPRV